MFAKQTHYSLLLDYVQCSPNKHTTLYYLTMCNVRQTNTLLSITWLCAICRQPCRRVIIILKSTFFLINSKRYTSLFPRQYLSILLMNLLGHTGSGSHGVRWFPLTGEKSLAACLTKMFLRYSGWPTRAPTGAPRSTSRRAFSGCSSMPRGLESRTRSLFLLVSMRSYLARASFVEKVVPSVFRTQYFSFFFL